MKRGAQRNRLVNSQRVTETPGALQVDTFHGRATHGHAGRTAKHHGKDVGKCTVDTFTITGKITESSPVSAMVTQTFLRSEHRQKVRTGA